jgi:hypothetical protein
MAVAHLAQDDLAIFRPVGHLGVCPIHTGAEQEPDLIGILLRTPL